MVATATYQTIVCRAPHSGILMAKSFNSANSRNSKNSSLDPAIANLRTPPHSIEAEQAVLGGLLPDNAAFDKITDLIGKSDLHRDEHKRIYRQIHRFLERNKPVDVVTCSAWVVGKPNNIFWRNNRNEQ